MPRSTTMAFCRLVARLGQVLLRQIWPSAGCARRVVLHDPLPHETIERVLLCGDVQCIIFSHLCNTLDPGAAVAVSSISSELRALTLAQRQQLKADYNAAAALALKLGMKSCKELREAKTSGIGPPVGLSADNLATLGTLVSVLPALETLGFKPPLPNLNEQAPGPDGVQQLAEKLGAGALPALTALDLRAMHVGDAGASALAAALDRGALPRLTRLLLTHTAIGDAGLVALAPALLRRPRLHALVLDGNRLLGDEGAAALVAPPPPPAGATPPPTGELSNLTQISLRDTQVTDRGFLHLAAALRSGALPALIDLFLRGTPVSATSKHESRAHRGTRKPPCPTSRLRVTRVAEAGKLALHLLTAFPVT